VRVPVQSEAGLAALAFTLGAQTVGELTQAELALGSGSAAVPRTELEHIRSSILAGEDPLGDFFSAIRTPQERREQGAVYTPHAIVEAMAGWSARVAAPDRVVDPGAGSGRFLLAAGRVFPKAELVAVELDPLAALMARANLAVSGMGERASVLVRDFRSAGLKEIGGRTLYLGNPPYVRHHLIDRKWKDWLKREASELGLKANALAGLHVYFFLAIARWAKPNDFGALITAAEWMDVNYGQMVRDLFLDRLGGQAVYVIDPSASPFPGTQTTAAVTTFTVSERPRSARFARIAQLDDLGYLSGGRRIRRDRLMSERRWSHFTRTPREVPEGYVELGELCRVHRGQVTGANRIWIAGEHSKGLPEEVVFATVTRAKELFAAGATLADSTVLRRVIDLPVDLSVLSTTSRKAVERFLKRARALGALNSYIAMHRKAWWSVGLRKPAPVLATYMARRPPAFVLNEVRARHLNIAHGIYPRDELSDEQILALVKHLRAASSLSGGRVYAGGLTKFEPREMERIPVPEPDALVELAI